MAQCDHKLVYTSRGLMVCTNCGKTYKPETGSKLKKKAIILGVVFLFVAGIFIINPMDVLSTFVDTGSTKPVLLVSEDEMEPADTLVHQDQTEPADTLVHQDQTEPADILADALADTLVHQDQTEPADILADALADTLVHQDQTEPEDTMVDKKSFDPYDILTLPNLFKDDTPAINPEYLTFRISPDLKPYENGIIQGLSMWVHEFDFVQTDSRANIEITRLFSNDEHDGLGCLDCLGDSTIDVVISSTDCNGELVTYGDGRIANIVAHEFGHNIGLEHHTSEDHLMWSEDDPQIPYDDLGHDIPIPLPEFLVGEQILQTQLDKYEVQSDEYSIHLDRYDAQYEKADSVYNKTKLRYEMFESKYNEIKAQYDAARQEYHDLLRSYGFNPDSGQEIKLEKGYYERALNQYLKMDYLTLPLNNARDDLDEPREELNQASSNRNRIIDEQNSIIDEHNRIIEEQNKLAEKINCLNDISEIDPAS